MRQIPTQEPLTFVSASSRPVGAGTRRVMASSSGARLPPSGRSLLSGSSAAAQPCSASAQMGVALRFYAGVPSQSCPAALQGRVAPGCGKQRPTSRADAYMTVKSSCSSLAPKEANRSKSPASTSPHRCAVAPGLSTCRRLAAVGAGASLYHTSR